MTDPEPPHSPLRQWIDERVHRAQTFAIERAAHPLARRNAIYFPQLPESNTARYGLLGTVFSLLSIILVWTYAFSTALVVGAVVGEWLNGDRGEPPAEPSTDAGQEMAPVETSTSTRAPSTTR